MGGILDINKLINEVIADLQVTKTSRNIFFQTTPYTLKYLSKSHILSVPELSTYLNSKSIDFTQKQLIDFCAKFSPRIPKQEAPPSDAFKEIQEGGISLYFDIDTTDYLTIKGNEATFYPPDYYFSKLGRDELQAYKASAKPCRSVFNHKNTYRYKYVENEGEPYTLFNRFQERWWMKEEYKPQYSTLPPQIAYFLALAVPSETDREILLSWTANMFQDYNQTILNNRGERGAGKSKFTELVAKVLGYSSPALAAQSDFDGEKRDKRLIYYEDSTYIGTERGYRTRKNLTDTSKLLNVKHRQAKKSEVLHTSYIINSNSQDSFYNEYDDRKSVYITWTDKNLGHVEDPELQSILDYITKINEMEEEDYTAIDREFITHLGQFFMNYTPSISNTKCIFNEQFYRDIVESLPQFKRYVMEKILLERLLEVDYLEMKKQFRQDNALGGKGNLNVNYFSTFFEFFDKRFLYKGNKVFISYDEEESILFVNPEILSDEHTTVKEEIKEVINISKEQMGGFDEL